MSYNLFGHAFRFMTWGESHGPAIGCVIDGTPPQIELSEADIQPDLDHRKPGQSKLTTQRREADKVEILSGVFDGQTTGTPISLIIRNTDQRSKDYGDIKDKFRPGHADYTYWKKYGIRDYRGGGRSSARETAMRVAAGAIAKKIIPSDVRFHAGVVQLGEKHIQTDTPLWDAVYDNPVFCPDPSVVSEWVEYLDDIRKSGSSVGAVVECRISNVPAGLGAPVYAKIESQLADAMMGINAVKGVEIGDGFAMVGPRGEDTLDSLHMKDGHVEFGSNHMGGTLGGITTGQDLVIRVAFKPTSSILIPQDTVTKGGENTQIVTKGRHDPCVGLRGTPVVEGMAACVLADQFLMHRAQIQPQF